eukprot:GFUD01009940.1.p1 GENE.GFUD01009940.1~~GFUD01009940.1.p1  ORF type:complete len:149 (-),score=47.97 GFUD01009940.1:154-600(-)
MASSSIKTWVQFDEEDDGQNRSESPQSKPWPITGFDDQQSSDTMYGSLSSMSSANSFMSTSDSESIEMSSTNKQSKYLAFKDVQHPVPETKEANTPEPSSHSSTECKYSAFSSLRMCEDKGEYLGWSKKVMGEGAMGWSEQIRAKPSF